MFFIKKVYIIHCWDGSKSDNWYLWLKKHLENNHVQVILENMPNSDKPTINSWVNKLESLVTTLDEDTYFIGHSIGCQTILRFLEKKDVQKIGGILLIAPWLDLIHENLCDYEEKIAHEWIQTPIEFEKLKKFTSNITAIFSSNDFFVASSEKEKFQKFLNANIITVENKGHFTEEDGVCELPEIISASGKMLGFELLEIFDKKEN